MQNSLTIKKPPAKQRFPILSQIEKLKKAKGVAEDK